MKKLVALLFCLVFAAAFSSSAFADEIDPDLGRYTGSYSEEETSTKQESETRPLLRMNAITFSNLCMAGGIALSAGGIITLAVINKRKPEKSEADKENTDEKTD